MDWASFTVIQKLKHMGLGQIFYGPQRRIFSASPHHEQEFFHSGDRLMAHTVNKSMDP